MRMTRKAQAAQTAAKVSLVTAGGMHAGNAAIYQSTFSPPKTVERIVAMLAAREIGRVCVFGLEDEKDDAVVGVADEGTFEPTVDQGEDVANPAEVAALRGAREDELELAVSGGLSRPAE